MTDQAAHENRVNYDCTHDQDSRLPAALLEENQNGVDTGCEESHDKQIYDQLEIGIDITQVFQFSSAGFASYDSLDENLDAFFR